MNTSKRILDFLKNLWNFFSTDIGWVVCVMGAAWDVHWPGLVVVAALFAVHLFVFGRDKLRPVILTGLLVMAIGFVVDTGLIVLGVVEPKRWLMPAPLTTLWDILLWANFSLSLDTSLRFLQRRFFLAGVLGCILGPAAYWAAFGLGAMRMDPPILGNLLWISAVWLCVMPLLALVARRIYHHPSADNST